MARSDKAARIEVLAAAQAMSRLGLSPGRSGNVSRRYRDGMLITPSGLNYDGLTPDDIVHVPFERGLPPGQRRPSSEGPFHQAIYEARPDIGAVVHTHSMHATVLACLHRPIPAFHYMVAVAGVAEIPCIPYATFGTRRLSRLVARGLARSNACLMAHHGAVAIGPNCDRALELAREIETLAEQYYKVLTLGKPRLLPRKEMRRVLDRFRGYGQAAAETPSENKTGRRR